jgi:ATP-binding cassette subfamily B protein
MGTFVRWTPQEKIKRTIRLVWQTAPRWTLFAGALAVIQGVLPFLTLYFMKVIIDALAHNEGTANAVMFRWVALLISLAAGVTLLATACRSVAGFASQVLAEAVTEQLDDLIQAKSLEIDLEYYESSQYRDTLHRAQQEAPLRPMRVLNGLLQIGRSGVSLVSAVGLLLLLHWGIVVILLVVALPAAFVQLTYAERMHQWQRRRTVSERQSRYFSWILTGGAHAKEIRLFGLGRHFINRFRNLRRDLRREKRGISRRRCFSDLIGDGALTLAVFGLYGFLAYRSLQGSGTIGDLVMYYYLLQRGQDSLQQLFTSVAGLYEDNLFLSNLYEFLDLQPKIVEPSNPKLVPGAMKTGIVFDHVTFRYSAGSRDVLADISFTIRPGEHVAFVGENGAGKTTLIKLLCRLYDPTDGTISLDGVGLPEFKAAELRRHIGIIFQDYACYHLTARENIWFGNIEVAPDHEEILTAARNSGADEVISALPKGYDTTLGKWFGEGEELSIGEWQKVALARAFLRDAQIIVLDEPSSALDAKAEYELFKKFHHLAQGRTAILISHRLSTVRMVDRIYVLKKGRITENGRHDDLVKRNGTYSRLFQLQAQNYR